MNRKGLKYKLIILFVLCLGNIILVFNIPYKPISIENKFTLDQQSIDYGDITIISDNETLWNNGTSGASDMAFDSLNNIHIVWRDNTDGPWGSDDDIMYTNYSESNGWMNPIVISDDETNWNDDYSWGAKIAIDNYDNIHIVWADTTDGPWTNGGWEWEIMYRNMSISNGWSEIIVISDNSSNWNDGYSIDPNIAVDNMNNIHVVWADNTPGPWGTEFSDYEIMHCFYNGIKWSNPSVISDGYEGIYWNDGSSHDPQLAIDISGNIHIVWKDNTVGIWGTNPKILYAYNNGTEWSNATLINDVGIGAADAYASKHKIIVDSTNKVYIAWEDWDDGSSPTYIVFKSYTEIDGWSNNTIVSESGSSDEFDFTIDLAGNLHFVWNEYNLGSQWGYDTEVMYSILSSTGWKNSMIISDNETLWNTGDNYDQIISIDDDGLIHVIWTDTTDGIWGTDSEIMYMSINPSQDPPAINTPIDIVYEEDMIGNEIIWIASDLDPNNYTITEAGYIVKNGTWNSNIPIITNVDDLTNGLYTYNIEVFDQLGNSTIDSVNVTVLEVVNPNLTISENITYTEGEIGNLINWSSLDLFPDYYIITLDGINIENDIWISEETNSIDVDNLSIGVYNFTIIVFDQAEHMTYESVWVTVLSKKNSSISLGFSFGFISIVSIIGIAIYIKKKI